MPTSVQALIVIAVAITPGYICLWIARQAIRQVSKQSDVELVLSTIAVGFVVNGMTFPIGGRQVLQRYRADTLLDRPGLLFLWAVLTIIVVPVCLGFLLGWAINRYPRFFAPVGLDATGRILHAWDYAMQRPDSYYVRVWMKEGGVIGGRYSTDSFASSDRQRPDLFLEEVWFLDGDDYFLEPDPGSAGVWIAAEGIVRVEFTEEGMIGGSQ